MSVFVKICGVTDESALDAAVAAGANAVGFVFHEPSPRNIDPRRAAALAARLPPEVLAVAVTLHPDQSLVDAVLGAFRPDAWQTDAGDFARLRMPAGVPCWPVVRESRSAAASLSARLVFDGPESGRRQRADWREAACLARRAQLILGGGLDAGNVAAAVAAVVPFGVDVSSGVERAPGVKDPRLIAAFVAAARTEVAA